MAIIKSYTDLEQSRKLAEILPLESADMFYNEEQEDESYLKDIVDTEYPMILREGHIRFLEEYGIPCWSLAALLSIFDCYEINKFGNNIQFDAKGIALSAKENETILDIVVDTIILLHKQNLL